LSESRDDAHIFHTGPSPRGWHRLQLAAECLQRYAWRYESPPSFGPAQRTTSPALAKGSLIHLALAQYYGQMRERQNGRDPESYCDPEEAVRLIARLEGTESVLNTVIDSFEAYKLQYPFDEEEMRILEIEALYSTKIAGKYLLTGRMDLVIEDNHGRVWAIDHKTTGRMQKAQKQYYAVSGQLLGYSHMCRERYGDKYAGFRLNLIQHGKHKFERLDLTRSPEMESKFEQSIVDIEEAIENMQVSGRDFDDWPRAMSELVCGHRYGACNFMSQCRYGAGAKKGGSWNWGSK